MRTEDERPEEPPHSLRRMPSWSRYAGEPIDVSSRRSIEFHGDSFDERDDRVVIDYFYHAGDYWTAIIPLDGTQQVRGQAFNFSKPRIKMTSGGPIIKRDRSGMPTRSIPCLNHLQSRFILALDDPILLYPLFTEPNGRPAHSIDDFVYSIEVVGPAGTSFNLRDAFFGNMLCAHRFISTQEMVFERIVVERQCVTETPSLALSEVERRALLTRAIRRSARAGCEDRYFLFRLTGTNNCTSNPFEILDGVVSYGIAARLGSLLYRLPVNPRFYLRARGLDSKPDVRRLVRDEFTEYINAPATRQRKREYVRRAARARRVLRQRAANSGQGR
jgi:hypothetical protein